jgi:hypothetical protein
MLGRKKAKTAEPGGFCTFLYDPNFAKLDPKSEI